MSRSRPRRWPSTAAHVLAAAAVCVFAAGIPVAPVPGAQAASQPGSAVLARGWGRVVVAGILTSAAASAGIMSVTLVGPARADMYDGTSWHARPLAGTRSIHLLPQTVMMDSAGRPVGALLPRAGDRVAVWGVMTPDDEIMALSLVMTPARPTASAQAPPAPPGHVSGVVAARSGSTLDVVTDTGVRHAVVLTGTTQVRGAGSTATPPVSPFDVLQIDGAVNSDGSLVATRVNVQFFAARGAQVSGPIEEMEGDLDGLVVGETMVCTSAQTYFLQGSARLWIAQMSVGRPVTVYGVPIVVGNTPVGLAARVVAVR